MLSRVACLARVALRPCASRLAPKGVVATAAARRSFVTRPAARLVAVPSLARLPVRRTPALVARAAVGVRSFSSFGARHEEQQQQQRQHRQQGRGAAFAKVVAAGLAAVGASVILAAADDTKVNYDAVRKDIADILDAENYDDGSYGPLFVRLAWHASGTYDKASNTGGSDGATMRYKPESSDGANAGLALARDLLEKVKAKHPGISYADLWTLAGAVAVEELGGPKIAWRPGRRDKKENDPVPPNGRLPDASKKADHIRAVFYRMGFNDREIVALAGAHALGRCHRDRSGFEGPWTNAPTTFSNEYFRLLVEEKWTPRKWDGPAQFQDSTGKLMMLPADLAFIEDPEFRKIVEIYSKDEKTFFNDFAAAFAKLLELGVAFK